MPPALVPDSVNFVLTSAFAPLSPTENGLYRYCSTADIFSGTPLLTLDSTFRVDWRSWVLLISFELEKYFQFCYRLEVKKKQRIKRVS